MSKVNLEKYEKDPNLRGRSIIVDALWQVMQFLFVSSFQPCSSLRVFLLRLFGAKIGKGVRIKPFVKIKYPWKLQTGDYTWIGEAVWIDNMDDVTIGSHCCLSQGTYLCTGNHDWQAEKFDLITRPIVIEDGVWIAACCLVSPGVAIKSGSVITLGSVVVTDTEADTVYSGNPAKAVKRRGLVSSE